jgi:hypothetical protein
MSKTFPIILLTTIFLASPAYSSIITFTDRNAWTSAVGGTISTIDFNGLAQGSAWWLSSSTTIGTTEFSSDGGDLWALDPSEPWYANYYSSDYLLWNPALDEDDKMVGLTLTITFPTPVRAAGWDFGTLDGSIAKFVLGIGETLPELREDGYTTFTTTSTQGDRLFFGVLSDIPFSEITMLSADVSLENEGAMGTLDDLSYAVVPEPATLLLLSLGLVSFTLARRKHS